MRKLALLLILIFVGLAPAASFAEEERHTDHEALRALAKTAKEAINSKNFDALTPILAKENLTIITVDNHKFASVEEFKAYWEQLFQGKDAVLDNIQVDPSADNVTEFLADNIGTVDGVSNETYHFKDGDVRNMQTRWSAVVKQEDGAWKIVKIHFSANLLDNPVLDAVKKKAESFILIAAIAGFALGALVKGFMRCRKVA